MKARSLCLMAVASALITAPSAFANGRFPRAQRILETPGRPERLTIAATYGLLVTENRGRSWSYVCDAAFTFQPMFASDVVIGLVADGSMLIGVQKSITISRDRGCDFTKVLEPPGTSAIDDFAMSATNANEVLALVTTFDAGKNTIRLQESMDGGQSWKVIGAPIPAELAYTIDIDPLDTNHLYVTGSTLSSDENEPALLLVSSDRGATWTTKSIPGTSANASPYIAAIHPKDGKKIFVRTDAWKKNAASSSLADDALLYSADGGGTWTELLRLGSADPELPGAKMLGFALSPDGTTVLVGYGDLVDPVLVVDPTGKFMGLYKSASDGSYSFGAAPVRLIDAPVTCLGWTNEGIYGCFAPTGQSHTLAFTADTNLSPASLTTLMKASEVLGPPSSCNGRAVSTCAWGTDCMALGACDAGPPPADGGGTGGAGGSGSTMDAATDGGRDASAGAGGASTGGASGSGSGGTAGATGGVTSGGGTSTSGNDGCGCRVFRSKPASSRTALAALLAFGALFRARRRRAVD